MSGGSDLIGDLLDEINFVVGFFVGLYECVIFGVDVVWCILFDVN